jgi:hypothetical protein
MWGRSRLDEGESKNSSTRGEEGRMGMKSNETIAPPNEQNPKERLMAAEVRFEAELKKLQTDSLIL